ncbi:Flp pilus assembly protein CpaB [Phocoenobacter uteri]|uniref:Flp pilus assembly protein CpaB n=1 Tax=Phocoenobacter uteri TaxID=146806 RepID=A0A379CAV2_9PAST|nr:RcpC/CpaB family pilus assembly protein [Phocoenobacter uteri]MDG6882642.1 hypothetical protein [Phocoenobacter uteri]SUB58807.1 Flp pilus assembly protein CpaB [Phocoenobacter uteri]
MNYRVLFIISFLILGIGFLGLFFAPEITNNEKVSQEIQSVVQKVKTKTVVVTTATLKRNVEKGSLLQEDDYQLSDLTLETTEGDDEPLLAYDLKPLFEQAKVNSLQGFLLDQNMTKDSIIDPTKVIAPNSPEFLVSSINPAQEVAYNVPVKGNDDYILQTVKSGTYVSVYSYQDGVGSENQNRNDLVKVLDNLLVLQVVSGQQEEQEKKSPVAGFVTLKMTAEQAKKLYTLPKRASLVLLPTDKSTPVNSHGTFIRKLRG